MARRPPPPKPLGRKPGKRPPEVVIAIYCEGRTEKHYLEYLAKELRRTGATVEIVGQQGVPSTVVARAVERMKALRHGRHARYRSEVWAVCDRDDHPCFDRAAVRARDVGVGFAWSNPCVELWALLHVASHTAYVERGACQQALSSHMRSYHHERNPYFDVAALTGERREQARARAIQLHRRAETAGRPRGNPTTAMWKLVDVLVEGSTDAAEEKAQQRNDGSSEWWRSPKPQSH